MSSILSIIIAIIILIFYVARSVEKQNKQEQKRRAAQRRTRQAKPKQNLKSLQNETPKEKRPREGKSDRRMSGKPAGQELSHHERMRDGSDQSSRYRELQKRLNQETNLLKEQGADVKAIRPAVKPLTGQAPVKNRGELRRAFLFSECIAEPRAKRPHPSIKKYRSR